MKYKLLKDTPTIKAGTIFEEVTSDFDELKELARITPIGAKTSPQFTIQDINNFDEWFEEIEEPVDSIHWKPKFGNIYWCIDSDGEIIERRWQNDEVNEYDYLSANAYNDLKEIEQARNRRLAEVRLRQTSDFKPDFKNSNGGWIVYYDYLNDRLGCLASCWQNHGESVRYATDEEAEKSIKENERDWLIYFGVKERED